MDFREKIRVIDNFPREGISFKDITTIIKDGEVFRALVDTMASELKGLGVEAISGPEARGFIFGVPIAYAMGVGFIPIRKMGKLPSDTYALTYDLEYGTDTLEVHQDAVKPGMKIALVDDLLATGGTIAACKELLEKAGAEVVAIDFVIELTGLEGRKKLEGYNVRSLVEYEY